MSVQFNSNNRINDFIRSERYEIESVCRKVGPKEVILSQVDLSHHGGLSFS